MMKEKYLERIPEWYKDENGKYETILSNDIDSLLSCAILECVKGWKIESLMFFNANNNPSRFDYLGRTIRSKDSKKEKIGVDLSLIKGKCFDNHVTKLSYLDEYNKDCINPNKLRGVQRSSYTNKYVGSTVLLLWSIYDLPMPVSEEGKMILLAIDSSFKGYYSDYSKFNETNKYYLCDILGLEELYNCLGRHKEKDFIEIIKKYNLNRDFRLKEGFIDLNNVDIENINKEISDTGIHITAPTEQFYLEQKFQDICMNLTNNSLYSLNKIDNTIYSCALVGKNTLCYSIPLIEDIENDK